MIKLTYKLIPLLLLAVPVLQAQVILPEESRSRLLSGMETTLANIDREPVDFAHVPSPFIPPEEAPEQDLQATPDKPLRIVVSSRRLEDADALRAISTQFKPIGSLVVGERGVLQLANGNTMEEGSSFPAKIKGHTYVVVITEVTSKAYTLRLGSAQVQRNFIKDGSSN